MKTATRLLAVLGAVLSLGSFGVDFLMDGQLTWSLLIAAGVIILAAAVVTWRKSTHQKALRTAVTLSILLIPYVLLWEHIAVSHVAAMGIWRGSLTVVAAFWLLAFWSIVLVASRGKNPFIALGLALLLIVTGVILTRGLLGASVGGGFVFLRLSGLILAGILSIALGARYKSKKGGEKSPQEGGRRDQRDDEASEDREN